MSKDLKIEIKDKDGNPQFWTLEYEYWLYQQDWYAWKEYLMFRYPRWYLEQNGTKRIPNREGEEESFENWKLKGKPGPGLFSIGPLIENDFKKLKQLLGIWMEDGLV